MLMTLVALGISAVSAGKCGDCWCTAQATGGKCPDWRPKEYGEDFYSVIKTQVPLNPIDLTCNSYEDKDCTTTPPQPKFSEESVCGHKFKDEWCGTYEIIDYPSEADAINDGSVVSHHGVCAACSTRQDLAVYMKYNDMKKAGQACAIKGLISLKFGIKCYKKLGMTEACSKIWAFNGKMTAKSCLIPCMRDLFAPYVGPYPTCALNKCLQCDEDMSGPIFKKFAGRTRRNSGLESAITRPCNTVAKLKHEVCPFKKAEKL